MCPTSKKRNHGKCLTISEISFINDKKLNPKNLNFKLNINFKNYIQTLNLFINSNYDKFKILLDIGKTNHFSSSEHKKLIENRFNQPNQLKLKLNAIGKISNKIMRSNDFKDLAAAIANKDFEQVQIHIFFFASDPILNKAASGVASSGIKYIQNGRLFLGKSLNILSPIIGKVFSPLAILDLAKQINDLSSGNMDALIPMIGNSLTLMVDAADIVIVVLEVTNVIRGISAVTGPIGIALTVGITLGTQIFLSIQRVNHLNSQIYMTESDCLLEFLHTILPFKFFKVHDYEKLIFLKNLHTELVLNATKYLEKNHDYIYIFFPTYDVDIIKNFESKVLFLPFSKMFVQIIKEDIDHINVYPKSHAFINLRSKTSIDMWSRTNPKIKKDDSTRLCCFDKGDADENRPYGNVYDCNNAIGIEYLNNYNFGGNSALFDVGKNSKIYGFLDFKNDFLIKYEFDFIYGGNRNDRFIIFSPSDNSNKKDFTGLIDGKGGYNTLDLSALTPKNDPLRNAYINFINKDNEPGYYKSFYQHYTFLKLYNIHVFYGATLSKEFITIDCNTKLIDSGGGFLDNEDLIVIDEYNCFYETEIWIHPHTKILNNAKNGVFIFKVKNTVFDVDAIVKINLHPYVTNPNVINSFYFLDLNFDDFTLIQQEEDYIALQIKDSEKILNINTKSNDLNTKIILNTKDKFQITFQKKIIYVLTNFTIFYEDWEYKIECFLRKAYEMNVFIIVKSLIDGKIFYFRNRDNIFMQNNPEYITFLIGHKVDNTFIITCNCEKLTPNDRLKTVYIYIHLFSNLININYINSNSYGENRLDLRDLKKKYVGNNGEVLRYEVITKKYISIKLYSIVNNKKSYLIEIIIFKEKFFRDDFFYVYLEDIPLRLRQNNYYDGYFLEDVFIKIDSNEKNVFVFEKEQTLINKFYDFLDIHYENFSFAKDENNLIFTNIFENEPKNYKKFAFIFVNYYANFDYQEITLKFLEKIVKIGKFKEIINAESYTNLIEKYGINLNKDKLKEMSNEFNINLDQSYVDIEESEEKRKLDEMNKSDENLIEEHLNDLITFNDLTHFKKDKIFTTNFSNFLLKENETEIFKYLYYKNLIQYNETLIFYAAENCNFEIVEALLLLDFQLKDSRLKNHFGEKPIHLAAKNNCLKVVELLLNFGDNVNSVDDNSMPVLAYALQSNNSTNLVKFLFKQGANYYNICFRFIINFINQTNLDDYNEKYVIFLENDIFVDNWDKYKSIENELRYFLLNDYFITNSNLNLKNYSMASNLKLNEISLQLMIEKWNLIDKINRIVFNRYPCKIEECPNVWDITRNYFVFLDDMFNFIEQGADIFFFIKLSDITYRNYIRFMFFFLENGYNLINAVKSNNINAVKEIFFYRTVVNYEDNNKYFKGYTALHWAAHLNLIEIGEILVNHGARMSYKSRYIASNPSPMEIAEKYQHFDFIEKMKQVEAKL